MGKELEKNSRAKKAIKKAFIKWYLLYPIEKITVAKVIEEAEYSRSAFYFHYDDIYGLLEDIEYEFFAYIGDYYDFSNQYRLEEDIEHEVVPECNVAWFERCLEYRDFLKGALSDHGNRLFEVKLRNKLREDYYKIIQLEGIPDDFQTKLALEYQIEGLIGVLRIAVYENKAVEAVLLAEVANTLRKYWHYANRKPHTHLISSYARKL